MINRRGRITTTTTLHSLLLSSFLYVFDNTLVHGLSMGGFQSGPSMGAMYAGGLHFDAQRNTVYMTGSHYNTDLIERDGTFNDLTQGMEMDAESSCYVTMLDMNDEVTCPDGDENCSFHTLTNWKSYGDPGVMETCSAITTDSKHHAYVVGSVEKGGFFHKNNDHPFVGLTAILDINNFEFINAAVTTSTSNANKHLLYPVAILHSELSQKKLFVAALTSTDNNISSEAGDDQPNWQEVHKYGKSFYLSVMKFTFNGKQEPTLQWISDFPVDADSKGEKPPVWVGGMLLQKDSNGLRHLLVAGSTRGSGKAYGATEPDTDDEDGFILQLSTSDGSFLLQKRHKGKKNKKKNKNDAVGVNNLREGTGSDDLIRGICQASEGPNYTDEFYIVGATKGDMTSNEQGVQNDLDEVNAGFQFGEGVESKYRDLWERDGSLMPFLRRVSFEKELGPVWTTQWAAMPAEAPKNQGGPSKTNAYAMDCVVDRNTKSVFVVGTVLKGAMMAQGDIEMINQGGDDIWVAKVDERTGNVHWMTQLGNYGDESPARHKSIAINNDGNVVIYGDTTSTLYRTRDDKMEKLPDMFIMIVDGETGAVDDSFYMGGTSSASVAGPVSGVPKDPPPSQQQQDQPQQNNQQSPPKRPDVVAASSNEDITKKKVNNGGTIFGILFGVVAVVLFGYFVYWRHKKRKQAENQKTSIFACLQKFDVEDIDLRRSPPGGWHGTYMNKLAYGQNDSDGNGDGRDGIMATDLPTSGSDDYEDKPLTNTHSSIANDSLFVEPATTTTTSSDTNGDDDGDGYKDNFGIDDDDDVDVRLSKGKMV